MRAGLHMQPVISAQFCERELGPAPAGFTGGYKEAIGFGRARLTERRATQVARAKPDVVRGGPPLLLVDSLRRRRPPRPPPSRSTYLGAPFALPSGRYATTYSFSFCHCCSRSLSSVDDVYVDWGTDSTLGRSDSPSGDS